MNEKCHTVLITTTRVTSGSFCKTADQCCFCKSSAVFFLKDVSVSVSCPGLGGSFCCQQLMRRTMSRPWMRMHMRMRSVMMMWLSFWSQVHQMIPHPIVRVSCHCHPCCCYCMNWRNLSSNDYFGHGFRSSFLHDDNNRHSPPAGVFLPPHSGLIPDSGQSAGI